MTSYPLIQRLAVPVAFHSVVVRRDAVAKRFPGGTDQFDRTFKSTRGNADLTLLVSMSMDDADLVFSKLHRAGLVPGDAFGLVGMHQGVMVPCHGVRAIGIERAPLVVEWLVQFDPDYRYQPEDVALEWNAPPASIAATPTPEAEPVTVPTGPQVTAGRRWEPGVGLRGGGLFHRFGGDDGDG